MQATAIASSQLEIPANSTSVYDAIFGRRTPKGFTDDPVSRETLERLFASAVWAPNHRLTEPFRFFALDKGGETRREVADLVWAHTFHNVANPNVDQKRSSADHSRSRVLDAPAMAYVYSVPGPNDEVTRENYATVCCAVQNMALAAVAEGLALDWSTGGVTRPSQLADTLGADPDWEMVGAIFIGVPSSLPDSRRTPHSEMVSWLE